MSFGVLLLASQKDGVRADSNRRAPVNGAQVSLEMRFLLFARSSHSTNKWILILLWSGVEVVSVVGWLVLYHIAWFACKLPLELISEPGTPIILKSSKGSFLFLAKDRHSWILCFSCKLVLFLVQILWLIYNSLNYHLILILVPMTFNFKIFEILKWIACL